MEHWDWVAIAVVLAIAWLAPGLGERWLSPLETFASRIAARRSAAIALIFFATIALRLALLPVIPVPVPGIADEFSYLLQADTFAHGRLANPSHPLWLSFETFHINWFPTYSGMFPPAQSFMLAAGQILGHPWIGVLLSVAAMGAGITWMLQGWLPARWALLGGVISVLKLGLLSYYMNSYWGGAVAAAGGALLLGALTRIFRKPGLRDALLLGLGVAILANSRPLEGVIFCLPAAGMFLFWLWRDSPVPRRLKMQRVVAPLLLLLVLTGAFMGYYNWCLTGNALLLPHSWNWRNYITAALFIWEENDPPRHYNNRQLEHIFNVWAQNNYQRSWPEAKRVSLEKFHTYGQTYLWPGAFPLWFFLPLVLRDRRMRLLLLTALLSTIGLFLVVWSLPHYAAPLTCVLYALLLQSLRHLRLLRFAGRPVGIGLSRVIVLLLLVTVGTGLYQRIRHPYVWGWNGDMGNWERAEVLKKLQGMPGKHLALVHYGAMHNIHQEWIYNDADIDAAKVVWARDMGPEQNRKLFHYYPDRQIWLLEPEDAPGELSRVERLPAPHNDSRQVAPDAPSALPPRIP